MAEAALMSRSGDCYAIATRLLHADTWIAAFVAGAVVAVIVPLTRRTVNYLCAILATRTLTDLLQAGVDQGHTSRRGAGDATEALRAFAPMDVRRRREIARMG